MERSVTAGGARRSRATARNAAIRGPIRWQRVGRLALLGTLAAILLLYIPPLMHWVEQHGAQSRGKIELRALQREHDRLKARLDGLSSAAGLDRAARGLGMVHQGERPYVIENPLPH